ncbi:hypothetical protein ACGFXC_24145 [Streptomyces sp. NPDC048507]|uniref:hypothetical protein n=1 Tax=Streptomyces sp. NPDC048507 TaxID=3365560 RepID=UPI00372267B0
MQHFQTLDDGRVGCWIWNCGAPATRWMDLERYGIRRWLATAYCDDHGQWELDREDPTAMTRERKIR